MYVVENRQYIMVKSLMVKMWQMVANLSDFAVTIFLPLVLDKNVSYLVCTYGYTIESIIRKLQLEYDQEKIMIQET